MSGVSPSALMLAAAGVGQDRMAILLQLDHGDVVRVLVEATCPSCRESETGQRATEACVDFTPRPRKPRGG